MWLEGGKAASSRLTGRLAYGDSLRAPHLRHRQPQIRFISVFGDALACLETAGCLSKFV